MKQVKESYLKKMVAVHKKSKCDTKVTEIHTESSQTTHIFKIPRELLLMLFSFLSHKDGLSLHATCRALRNIHHEKYKQRFLVKPNLDFEKKDALQNLLDFSKHYPIRVLNLHESYITDAELKAIVENCTEIIDLNLAETQITNVGVTALAQAYPRLASLNLSGCEKINDESIATIVENCREITDLNLDSTQITNVGVTALAQAYPLLASLNLSGCKEINDESIEAIVKNCREITDLNLAETQITNVGVTALAQGYPHLTSLNLSGCEAINDESIKAIVENCKKITDLNLDSTQLTNNEVTALAQTYPLLASLIIGNSEINDDALPIIANNLPDLTSLSILGTDIEGETLQGIENKWEKLKSLYLNCTLITDSGLKYILKNCPNLTFLSIEETDITDAALADIAHHCPKLETLNLESCNITDAAQEQLRAVLPHCRIIR